MRASSDAEQQHSGCNQKPIPVHVPPLCGLNRRDKSKNLATNLARRPRVFSSGLYAKARSRRCERGILPAERRAAYLHTFTSSTLPVALSILKIHGPPRITDDCGANTTTKQSACSVAWGVRSPTGRFISRPLCRAISIARASVTGADLEHPKSPNRTRSRQQRTIDRFINYVPF
jgi:hypothetical protein